MDREMFDHIVNQMNQELDGDRVEVNNKLDEKYNRMEFVGTQEQIAKARAEMEAQRQQEFEDEMTRREAARKELHFPDESFDEVQKRLEAEERTQQQEEQAQIQEEQAEQLRKSQEIQQQQTEQIREQETARKIKEEEELKQRQEEQTQEAAEKSKTDNEQLAKQQYQNEYSRINQGETISAENAPVDESQSKDELTQEEKMAEYDRRMREHFDKSNEREQDNDRGY